MELLRKHTGEGNPSEHLSEFFIKLYRDVIETLRKDSEEPGRQDRDNFLEVPIDFLDIQVSLRKSLLMSQMCEKFGEKLLSKTSQTIELLKTIIMMKADKPTMEGDEVVVTSFGILSTYMRDEIKLSKEDESEIKRLLEPLRRIMDTASDSHIAGLANDLRICIATKTNISSLSYFTEPTGEDHQKDDSLSVLVKDLADPLIPSRAHAIMQIGKRFARRDPFVLTHIDVLQSVVLDNLTHDDSYVFLAAAKCLAQIAWSDTDRILTAITGEIHKTGRREDDRVKLHSTMLTRRLFVDLLRTTRAGTHNQFLASSSSSSGEDQCETTEQSVETMNSEQEPVRDTAQSVEPIRDTEPVTDTDQQNVEPVTEENPLVSEPEEVRSLQALNIDSKVDGLINTLNSKRDLFGQSSLGYERLNLHDTEDDDLFNVKSLFTLDDLFENKVHLGHSIGCWNPANRKYLFGSRNGIHLIDLANTEQHLWRALNVVSHVAARGGKVVFINDRDKMFNSKVGNHGNHFNNIYEVQDEISL
eukprot:sb/3463797/